VVFAFYVASFSDCTGMLVSTIPLSWCCGSCHGHLLVLHTHACTHGRHKDLAVVVLEGFS
jgi:hypothetical protein